MTVIAYDGKTVAADKQSSGQGARFTTTKLFRASDGAVVAMAGRTTGMLEMLAWYNAGCPPDMCPKFDDKDDTEMHVFRKGYRITFYDGRAFPAYFDDVPYAAGSGRDFAWAAMHCGKSPREAVEIACMLSTTCGMGIDVMEVEEHAPQDANTGGDTNAGGPAAAEGGAGPAARPTGQGVSDQVSGGAVGGGPWAVSGMRWEPQVTLPFPEPPGE